MNVFSKLNPSPRAQQRMVDFFNRVYDPYTITELDLLQPAGENDYGIGPVVAQRILDRKSSLVPPFFTDISQLEDIEGLGPDKAEDLVRYMEMNRADVFVRMMRKYVLPENFELHHRILTLEAAAPYLDDEESYRNWLAREVLALSDREPSDDEALKVDQQIAGAFVDHYDDAHIAGYAMALWFYRFAQDNWASFEQFREQAENYLAFAGEFNTLQLYKGFENRLIMHRGVTVTDLMVVQNATEQTINIFTAQLMD